VGRHGPGDQQAEKCQAGYARRVSASELNEHGSYVSDVVKIDAYRRALTNLIRPDDVVIDMGCGTGLLGLLALEAGAAKVIAVDSGPILELARETFDANGFGDRVEYRRMRSSELTLEKPATCSCAIRSAASPTRSASPATFGTCSIEAC
jgi:2-polyprenyl-3-methyl-5-hydroxy-6-metoxy-1,4-benzoquinol methylase